MRARFPLVMLAGLLPVASGMALAQDADATDLQPDEHVVSASAEEMPPVARLFEVRDELASFLLSVRPPAAIDTPEKLEERIHELASQVDRLRDGAADGSMPDLRFNELLDRQTELRSTLRNLNALGGQLDVRAAARDADLDELDRRAAEWRELTEVAVTRAAPQSVLNVAAAMQREVDDVRDSLVDDRDSALEALSIIAGLQQLASAYDTDLRLRRTELEAVSQSAADLPMWTAEVWRNRPGLAAAAEAFRQSAIVIVNHVRANLWHVVGLFILLWAGAHWLLIATGKRVQEGMQKDSASIRGAAVFQRPSSAALLTALVGLSWLGPPAPAAFGNLLSAIVPFPAAALAITVFAKPIRLSIYTIAVVLAIMSLQPLVDTMPLFSRFVVIAQAGVTAFAVWTDYRHGRFAQALPIVRPNIIRWVVRCVLFVLGLTILIEIVGYVGLGNTLREFVLGGLGLGMTIAALAYVVIALALAVIHLRPFSSLPVVRNERWTIVRTIRRWVRYLALVVWGVAALNFAGLMSGVTGGLQSVLAAEFSIGEVTVNMSSLAAGAVILFATWLVASIVRFALAAKSLTGAHVASGVAFAVSKLLRYAIFVVGFMFALAVMGFDLTKVTVLAGALGIGIGFGLQNIVQNFISGLILLFERPININDVAMVDDVVGTVRGLNIRSTVIETLDGAEVIVPNSELIAKTVINLTKSNRQRRAEIEVGVAYGSDTQQVLDILERVATSCDEVASDPEPFAVFVGFGDNSLNFRVTLWLINQSDVAKVPSRMRQDILNELSSASIEIPFPQRDLRVTMISEASSTPAAGINTKE